MQFRLSDLRSAAMTAAALSLVGCAITGTFSPNVTSSGGSGNGNGQSGGGSITLPSGGFKPTGNLATGRFGHTATLLPNGQVFIAGGVSLNSQPPFANRTEQFDPALGTFQPGVEFFRSSHTATVLSNGDVLNCRRNSRPDIENRYELSLPLKSQEAGFFSLQGTCLSHVPVTRQHYCRMAEC